MNDIGANLANIQDDLQAGMMNMEEYINYLRIEQMHDKKEDFKLNYKTAKQRNENERPFKDQWDDGIKMGWKLTPVEDQKAQVNWRQDINSKDQSPEKLDSYQNANGPGSSGLDTTVSLTPGDYKTAVGNHKQFMDDVVAGKYDSQEGGNGSSGSNSSDSNDGKANMLKASAVRVGAGNNAAASGENGKDDQSAAETKKWWEEAKKSISTGFEVGKTKAEEAVKNLKLNQYEQTLQRVAGEAKVDPVMVMAVIAISSKGDPSGNGVFGLTPGKIEDQIDEGVKKVKELVDSKNKDGNPIGPITAWKGWGDNLEKALNGSMAEIKDLSSDLKSMGRLYNWEWRKALEEDKVDPTFYPAVIQAYQIIDAANTGLSQLKNQEEGIEFPIDTAGLNDIYWIQDFGVVNAGSGVGVASNSLVFQSKAGLKLHAPEKCNYQKGKNDELGDFITLTSDSTKRKYIFGGIAGGGVASNEADTGAECAQTTEKFMLQVQENDKYIDPKNVWRLLDNLSVSTETSVGAQLEKINNKGMNPPEQASSDGASADSGTTTSASSDSGSSASTTSGASPSAASQPAVSNASEVNQKAKAASQKTTKQVSFGYRICFGEDEYTEFVNFYGERTVENGRSTTRFWYESTKTGKTGNISRDDFVGIHDTMEGRRIYCRVMNVHPNIQKEILAPGGNVSTEKINHYKDEADYSFVIG